MVSVFFKLSCVLYLQCIRELARLIQVSVVLSFPIMATYFVFRYKTLQQQIEYILTTKKAFIDSNQLIAFKGQGSNDQITLSLTNFLYGKSQDNYVELYYIEKEQLTHRQKICVICG